MVNIKNNLKKCYLQVLNSSKPPILIALASLSTMNLISSDTFAANNTSNSKSCFVQFGGTGNGTSAKNPYGSLQEVESDNGCKVIHVLPASSPLDGGITLKDGQKIIGSGDNVYDNPDKQILPMITNTINADIFQTQPVIRLANNNTVENLKLLALSIGVLGNNATGVKLNDLLVIKAATYPRSAVVDPGLCDLTNAIYRGCNPNGVRNGNGGIQLLADNSDGNQKFSYLLNNILIKDIPNSLRWNDGVYVVAAGNNTVVQVNLNSVHVENVGRGYEFISFNTSKLISTVVNSSSKNSNNDALDALTSFNKATCSSCPKSDPTLTINIDGFTATPQPGSFGQGIEVFSFEPNSGTHEVHIANTSLQGFGVGFFIWNQNGYPKSSIYDLGCVNPNSDITIDRTACLQAGFTSLGNNNIFGNNAFAVNSTLYYSPGFEMLVDGPGNVMAQNNYWGPYSPGRITVQVDGQRRCGVEHNAQGTLIRDEPPIRCRIGQGIPVFSTGTINDDFPL